MVTRRQFSREFKIEAVKLVTERGVAGIWTFTKTCCASGFANSVKTRNRPSRGNGQMKPELAEIARLKKENAKLKKNGVRSCNAIR